jgi:predicted enzyme related to lactoylglutathione lyase
MKTHSVAPVFQVSNLDASLKHYQEVLGFSEDFRFGNYAGVRYGEAGLHLCEHTVHQKPVGGSTAYFFCDEVDTYAETVKKNGAAVKVMPQDWPYGMRDFTILDPDGNHIHFGCEIKQSH